jgi:hypothetical protein
MGSLYKHDVCKPDYVDHGMDKLKIPVWNRWFSPSLTNTDSRWIIAYTRYTRFLHTIYGWGYWWMLTPPGTRQRPTRVFEVPTTWRYVYWKGLRSWSHTSIRWRSTDWIRRCSACDSDTKYVFCWTRKSLTHTDIISTDSQKLCIIEEVYRSGVTAMKCHLKDRMPRSMA